MIFISQAFIIDTIAQICKLGIRGNQQIFSCKSFSKKTAFLISALASAVLGIFPFVSQQAFSAADDYLHAMGEKVEYWHQEKMPLKVWIQSDTRVPYYRKEFRDFAIEAMKAWTDAAGGKLSFSIVNSEPADIVVSWTEDHRRVLSSGELGETSWQYDQDGLMKANVTLLTVADQGSRPISLLEAKLIALHEIGHALGLARHSPYPGDIMVACIDFNINTPINSLGLSRRDKNTISKLYKGGGPLIEELGSKGKDPSAKLMRLCLRAKSLLQEGKFDPAYVLLQRALKLDPESPQALSAMAACCFEQGILLSQAGNYGAATLRLEQFIEICPKLNMERSEESLRARKVLYFCKRRMQK